MNVAPAHVMEILPGMDRTLAERVADFRGRQALTGMDDLSNVPGFPPRTRGLLMNVVGFASRYFMIRIMLMEDGGGGAGFNVIFNASGEIVRWEEI